MPFDSECILPVREFEIYRNRTEKNDILTTLANSLIESNLVNLITVIMKQITFYLNKTNNIFIKKWRILN